jgi:endonuclease YncB( thermonuclease family)
MRKRFLYAINGIFFAAFFVAIFEAIAANPALSQSQNLQAKSHPQFNQEFSGKAFVLDGDSLRVGGKEVRLIEIDAPEYSQTCFNEKKHEYDCGQISKRFLIDLVGGKEVRCTYAQKDKYDRFLSKCFLGEKSINQEILRNGMAVIYNFADVDEEIVKIEAEAKKAGRGIWRGAFELPKDYRKKHHR